MHTHTRVLVQSLSRHQFEPEKSASISRRVVKSLYVIFLVPDKDMLQNALIAIRDTSKLVVTKKRIS